MADVYYRGMFLLVWLNLWENPHLDCLEVDWCWRWKSKSKRWRDRRGPKIGPEIVRDLRIPQLSRLVLLNCEHKTYYFI